jgi:uncharacterized protein YkwD
MSLNNVRVSPFGDTTVKFSPLYPEISGNFEIEMKIIQLTNKQREKRNLPPLIIDPYLTIASRNHSYEMLIKGYFSHISPIYYNKTPAVRIYNSGIVQYRTGENIAQNAGTLIPILIFNNPDSLARIIVNKWMESPHHRDNILNSQYTNIGVGAIYRDTILKVTQNFVDKSISIDSIIIGSKNKEYFMDVYFGNISIISVFKDGDIIDRDSLKYRYENIRIPLKKKSGRHKIEFCIKRSRMYNCIARVYIYTDNHLNNIFQPLTEFTE